MAAAEADVAAARKSAMAEIESVAAEAAGDLVAKLSGVTVAATDAKAAVKAVLHGCTDPVRGRRRGARRRRPVVVAKLVGRVGDAHLPCGAGLEEGAGSAGDRKGGVLGKVVSVRVNLGCCRYHKQ